MSDLISRAAAIDAVRTYYDDEYALADSIEELIEKLPSAQLEQPWIPCSERLPEEGHEVLVCLTDWQTGDQKRVVSYRIDFNMWHGYGRYNEKCVAWMPLPEPYREDNHETD